MTNTAKLVTEGNCSHPSEQALLDSQTAEDLAAIFKALADPTRVRLLRHIASSPEGTVCACTMTGALGISQPTLSHHLKKLADSGLVTREQRGRGAHYQANPTVLALLRDYLSSTTKNT